MERDWSGGGVEVAGIALSTVKDAREEIIRIIRQREASKALLDNCYLNAVLTYFNAISKLI